MGGGGGGNIGAPLEFTGMTTKNNTLLRMNTMIYNLTYNYQINCYNKTIRSIQFWKKLKNI